MKIESNHVLVCEIAYAINFRSKRLNDEIPTFHCHQDLSLQQFAICKIVQAPPGTFQLSSENVLLEVNLFKKNLSMCNLTTVFVIG